MRFNSEVRVMACSMETKRAYVAPTLNLLVIRAEERFTASSGGCDIDSSKGNPDIIVKNLATDTLLAVSGMSYLAGNGSGIYALS